MYIDIEIFGDGKEVVGKVLYTSFGRVLVCGITKKLDDRGLRVFRVINLEDETVEFMNLPFIDSIQIKMSSRQRLFVAVSPSGKVLKDFHVARFSERHGLCSTSVANRIKGRIKGDYKGWMFYRMDNPYRNGIDVDDISVVKKITPI